MSYLCGMAIYCGRRSDRLRAEGDHEEGRRYDFERWRMIYDAVQPRARILARFSALRNIYWAHPAFLMGHIQEHQAMSGKNLAFRIGRYVVTAFLALLIGACAFVCKALEVSHLYMNEENRFLYCWIPIVGFLNQMLNIIDIEDARQDRLFLFIFGGEDALMQKTEYSRREAYLTRVMAVIW